MSESSGLGPWAVETPVTQSMTTRDGQRLDADVYRPHGAGPWPVLLMRQPYGRAIASTVCYAHPAWYASHGYVVVVQDVRGRGGSQGEFTPFETEQSDGEETIAWAAALAGSNGAVGLYGFSYQGSNQLLAAASGAAALRAMAPAMLGWDLRADWACENDAPLLAANIEWAVQLAAGNALRAGDMPLHRDLCAAARVTPVHDDVPARPAVLERARRYHHYFDWLDEPASSSYWARTSPHAQAEKWLPQAPPALFVGGWFDTHLRGSVNAHAAFTHAGRHDARLLIGPWPHFPWGRRLGDCDFGNAAIGTVDDLQRRWFDHWLKGATAPAASWNALRLFDLGRHQWLDLDTWPTDTAALCLHSGGRAALDESDGRLLFAPAAGEAFDWLVHDPWRPTPTFGGPWGTPNGPVYRTAIDGRSDVLTYTSDPLREPLTVVGSPIVTLDVQTQAPSFDLHAVLSSVDENGRSLSLTEGYRHFPSHPQGAATLSLRPTCVTFFRGERIRLSIAAACFPAFAVNPGDGTRPSDARAGTHRVITLTIRHGGTSRSALNLPLQDRGRIHD
ncbi:MAG: CocE/NonD family hydrolase [Gammaproteobacteria bacterium]